MKPTRSGDDEPDVIDLTACYGYHTAIPFAIRPPSPFADAPLGSEPPRRDHEYHAMMTWSEPHSHSLTYKMNNIEQPVFSSPCNSPSPPPPPPRNSSRWRRTLNKLLKRAKSVDHKEVTLSATRRDSHLYDFGGGDNPDSNLTITVRQNNHKRVHWFDEEHNRRHECGRFLEYLKLAVHTIRDDNNADYFVEGCQRSLNQLVFLVNYRQLEQAFEEFVELARQRDKSELIHQQWYIESLLPL